MRRFLRAVLFMGCLVVSLFVFEVLVRCFAPHPCYEEPMWIDVNTGYLMRPNFHGRATNMFGEFDTLIEINREGFRDFNHPLQKAPHTLRIAFLGDSFTCGEQVEENEVFVRRVGESLHGTLHRPVECLNFGIGGYDTQQEVLCYESFVRKYHPDVVVLEMYPRNDIIGNIFYETEQNFGRPYYRFQEDRLVKVAADPVKLQRNYETEKRHLGVRWYHHLQGYNAFKHLRWEILKYWDRYWVTKHPPSLTDLHREAWYESLRYYEIPSDAFVQRAEKATQLLLERLEREIRLDGGLFFIAIFPSYSSLWPERWPDHVRFYPGLEQVALDQSKAFKQIPLFVPDLAKQGRILDLRGPLQKADGLHSIFFTKDNHYNTWGHKAVAQAMAVWLEPQLARIP